MPDWFTRSHPLKGEKRTRNRSEIARVNGPLWKTAFNFGKRKSVDKNGEQRQASQILKGTLPLHANCSHRVFLAVLIRLGKSASLSSLKDFIGGGGGYLLFSFIMFSGGN
jgi:hypothetical protein